MTFTVTIQTLKSQAYNHIRDEYIEDYEDVDIEIDYDVLYDLFAKQYGITKSQAINIICDHEIELEEFFEEELKYIAECKYCEECEQ